MTSVTLCQPTGRVDVCPDHVATTRATDDEAVFVPQVDVLIGAMTWRRVVVPTLVVSRLSAIGNVCVCVGQPHGRLQIYLVRA